jgi:sigma-B regulation protein RsbU (phosphoserine phosphatase)
MVAEERLKRELIMAAEVQQRLFPSQPPASDCLELAGHCQPARGVGGDYYDFLRFDNQQIGFAVADVAGKGISAALVMSAVQASLRSQVMMHNSWAETSSSLADMVANMNWLLCGSTGSSTYATFFYGQFDERTLQMTYVNAGHNPPILVRPYVAARSKSIEPVIESHRDAISEINDISGSLPAVALARAQKVQQVVTFGPDADGDSVQLTVGGPVIGLFEQCPYEQQTVQLASGDILALFTDGVTEANNTNGDEFGEDRLRATLKASVHLPVEEIRSNIIRDVDAWCAGAPQHDDLTFIIIKVK